MARGKPRSGNSKRGGEHLPELVDLRLVKALDHVLRQHILLAAVAGEISPVELSEALREGLSQISYHVKVLRDDCDGMIEETRKVQRRGAIEHYYRASERTLFPAKRWRKLKKGLRAVVGAGQASDLFDDLAGALRMRKLQGEHDHINRTPLLLDEEGKRKVKAIAERVSGEIEAEQKAAARRMEKAGGEGDEASAYTFALLAFEAAWKSADLPASISSLNGAGGASSSRAKGAAGNGGGGKGRRRRALTAGK